MIKKVCLFTLIGILIFSIISLSCLGSPNIQVESISLNPTKTTPGSQVTIDVELRNTGSKKGTKKITFNINNEERSTKVELEPEQTKTFSFKYTLQELGNYNVIIGEKSEQLKVVEPAKFEFSNLQVSQREVNPRENVTVSVDVQNVGGVRGTQTVELKLEGQILKKEVNLDADEFGTVNFNIEKQEKGTYSLSIDDLSESFEVIDPAKFELSDLQVSPKEAKPGETVTVSINVKNVGRVENSYTVSLNINGELERTKEVTVSPNNSSHVEFSITKDSSKTYEVKVGKLENHFTVKHFEEVYRERDLVLEGNECLTIENKKYIMDGEIKLKDNAKLIITNSHFIMNISYFNEYRVWLYDNSKLVVKNSTLARKINSKVNIDFMSRNATLDMENSTSYWCINPKKGGNIDINSSEINKSIFFNFNSQPQVNLKNSSVRILMIDPLTRDSDDTIRFEGLESGKKQNLNIKLKNGALLKLNNSEVRSWVIDLWDKSWLDKHVVLKNSEIAGLWFWIGKGKDVTISDFSAGYYDYWNFQEEAEAGEVNYDLTLLNSSILGGQTANIKLNTIGHALYENLKDVQIGTWGHGKIIIKDSEIDTNVNLRGENDYIRIENSTIRNSQLLFLDARNYAVPGGDEHYIEFNNVIIYPSSSIVIATTYSNIKGEVNIATNRLEFNWGIVDREYPVLAKHENGDPVKNLDLTLIDPNGEKAWKGTTNEKGKAKFKIRFNENNYHKKWKLKTTHPSGIEMCQKISFLSDTPIMLSPNPQVNVINLGIGHRELLNAGERARFNIFIRNTGSVDVHKFETPIKGFSNIYGIIGGKTAIDLNKISISYNEEKKRGKVKIENITLPPGEKKTIPITISFENAGIHKVSAGELSKKIKVD